MKDALGNKLAPGNLVHWSLARPFDGVLAEVVEIHEPSLVSREAGPSFILLRIGVPVATTPGREAQLEGIKRVVNPAEQAALEEMMGKPKQ